MSVFLFGVLTAAGQTAQPPDYQRDGEILFKLESTGDVTAFPGGEGTVAQSFQWNASIKLTGYNKRTVGNGMVDQVVDTNGKLINAQAAIGDGLIAAEATIEIGIDSAPTGPATGFHPSFVSLNDCIGNETMINVYYGPDAREKEQKFRFTVPAGCLRYGTRSNPEAAEPQPAKNELYIVTLAPPPPAPSPLCRECGDSTSVWLEAPPWEGDIAWLRAKIPDVEQVFNTNGENEARKATGDWLARARFEALAPIALVHGYDSSVEYFEGETEPTAAFGSFAGYLRERKFGFEALYSSTADRSSQKKNKGYQQQDQPNADCDAERFEKHLISQPSTELMGRTILQQARVLATRHGADHVHIVAHSLGGIWSRATMVQAKQQELAPEGIGIYSLTTITYPHHGSAFADIKDTFKNSWKWAFLNPITPLYPDFWRGFFGKWNLTTAQARTDIMRDFNAKNSGALPSEFAIKGLRSIVKYTAIATDANIDGSTQDPHKDKSSDYGTIACGTSGSLADECAAERSCKFRFLGRDITEGVLQRRYTTLQSLQGIKTTRVLGLSWWKVVSMSRNSSPELNDFTLTTNSHKHPRFEQFTWGAEENDYYLKNHSVAGRRWLAVDLAFTILNARTQLESD